MYSLGAWHPKGRHAATTNIPPPCTSLTPFSTPQDGLSRSCQVFIKGDHQNHPNLYIDVFNTFSLVISSHKYRFERVIVKEDTWASSIKIMQGLNTSDSSSSRINCPILCTRTSADALFLSSSCLMSLLCFWGSSRFLLELPPTSALKSVTAR